MGWRGDSAVKSTDCSSMDPGSVLNTHTVTQKSSIAPVPRGSTPSVSTAHTWRRHTCREMAYIHKRGNFKLNSLKYFIICYEIEGRLKYIIYGMRMQFSSKAFT